METLGRPQFDSLGMSGRHTISLWHRLFREGGGGNFMQTGGFNADTFKTPLTMTS